MNLYDADHIRNFYDQYADLETHRWDKSPVEQIKLYVHQHHLSTHINAGDKVLELGAGTGIFTEQLASITEKLTITDISPVQLALNQKRSQELDYASKVQDWGLADITDLAQFKDETFDKVVCYGGPLSYVFDKKHQALAEIKRVLKPGGKALMSVMNLWGTTHQYLTAIMLEVPPAENEKVMTTGNLHPSSFTPSDHHCHMFRAEEFKTDLQQAGFEILTLSASNCLSAMRAAQLPEIKKDVNRWQYFLDLEIRACQSPGMIESGTHLIAVVQK
ncbi:MAG: class I SAM-dependent methyltransferase [Bacteroidia bacterium]